MRSNELKLNPDKTHILTMGTQQRLNTLPETIIVTMDNVVLEEDPSKCELLLGCQMAANLEWHQHISQLLGNLRTRLTGLAHPSLFAYLPSGSHHRGLIQQCNGLLPSSFWGHGQGSAQGYSSLAKESC